MENYQVLRLEQPRGPVFGTAIRANFQVGNRAARALGININEMRGIVARGLSDTLGDLGVPSERTIRHWESDRFDYPEQMIKAGMVNVSDILPPLKTYLDFDGYEASMQQPSSSYGDSATSSHVTQRKGPVAWLEGFCKISLFLGATWLVGSVLKDASNPHAQHHIVPPRRSRRRPLSVTDRRNRWR